MSTGRLTGLRRVARSYQREKFKKNEPDNQQVKREKKWAV